ncbi:MAG: response regulator transcription factor [Lachnospiraceae bacterium]|nr:response regulator transcription factor [Lachnospiraceae bacterium]
MMKRVLVVDDEKLIVKGIKFSLEHDGMQVDVAYDGEEALRAIQENTYDIVLLDVMLPKLSGYEVCQQVREFSMVPIIMVTAKSDDIDKILGLEYGADDYITKPFNILEVKARMKAIMRRSVLQESALESAKQLVYEGFLLDCESRRLFIDDKEVRLTTKEYEVLELLASHPNKIYSRDNLMNIIWGYEFVGDLRTVDVHVRRLREKIEKDPGEPTYIQTKWGSGYYFNDNE